jgi:hypothetical protein
MLPIILPDYVIDNIIREELYYRELQSRYFRSRAKEGPLVVPAIYQPVIEPAEGALRFIFIEPGAVHLVFNDEVAPNPVLDSRYRNVRQELYGRTTDVESIEIAGGDLNFRDDASGLNVYETSAHFQSTAPYQGEVYSSTWNHLMSCRQKLPILVRGGYQLMVAEIRRGSRADAEAA